MIGKAAVTQGPKSIITNSPHKTGVWMLLAAAVMTFAGIGSLMIVRKASGQDWQSVAVPTFYYLALLLLLAIVAVLSVVINQNRRQQKTPILLHVVWVGGLLVLAMVASTWMDLSKQTSLSSSPGVAAFYLLTGVYLMLLLGGVVGTVIIAFKEKSVVALESLAVYWRGLVGLWLFVLILLII